jgi:hypothetical protein
MQPEFLIPLSGKRRPMLDGKCITVPLDAEESARVWRLTHVELGPRESAR